MATRKKTKTAESGVVSVERFWTRSGVVVEGSEVSSEEPIDVPIFHTESARVGATLGITLNMGNYESVKVSISCSLPCYPNSEEMDAAYKAALKFSRDKLTEQVAIVKSKR